MNPADILDIGARVIPGEHPAGESCRDDPRFEALQGEVRKLELPAAPAPDWAKVASIAADLLSHTSKDLLVAAYLSVGLLHENRYEGLAAGLQILRDMIRDHWDALYPEKKRMRGRQVALEWLSERGRQAIGRHKPGPGDEERISGCLALVDELEDLLRERMETGAPVLAELASSLREAQEAAARPRAEPTPAATAAPSAAPAVPEEIASAADAERALARARQILRRVVEYYLKAEPANPLAYRLPRSLAWANVDSLPAHADGRTQIPGYQPPDFVERLQESLDRGQWRTVLEETESRFPSSILWLDLHRFACEALEGMGETHYPAAEAIRQELGNLLRRLPGLVDLKFRSGQPFASDATRRWIRERVLAAEPQGATFETPPLASPAGGEQDELGGFEAARNEARALARRKQVAEAVRLLHDGARRAPSLRAKVLWKVEAALLCMERKYDETALALLEDLDEELRRSSIEDWDPGLYAGVLKNLYLCHERVVSSMRQPPPEALARSREIKSRLYRLDVAAALALNGK